MGAGLEEGAALGDGIAAGVGLDVAVARAAVAVALAALGVADAGGRAEAVAANFGAALAVGGAHLTDLHASRGCGVGAEQGFGIAQTRAAVLVTLAAFAVVGAGRREAADVVDARPRAAVGGVGAGLAVGGAGHVEAAEAARVAHARAALSARRTSDAIRKTSRALVRVWVAVTRAAVRARRASCGEREAGRAQVRHGVAQVRAAVSARCAGGAGRVAVLGPAEASAITNPVAAVRARRAGVAARQAGRALVCGGVAQARAAVSARRAGHAHVHTTCTRCAALPRAAVAAALASLPG